MARYVIERVYDEAVHDDMENVGARSKRIAAEHFPDLTWEHSHVVSDETGIKSFCGGRPRRPPGRAGSVELFGL